MKMSKASSKPSPDRSEEDYLADEDARTLERMGEIMGDSKRHERAKKRMEKKMADMEKSKKAMKMMMGKKEEHESMGMAMDRANENHRA
jgi:hypothetical protein